MLVWEGASNIFVTTCLQHMLLDILYLWLFVYEREQREPSYIGSFYWKTLKPDTDNGKMKTENMVVGSHEWGLVVFSQWSPIPRSFFLLSLVFLRAEPIDKKPHLLSYKDLLSFFFHPSTRMKTPNRRTEIACLGISTYFIFSSVFIFNFVPFKKQSFIL